MTIPYPRRRNNKRKKLTGPNLVGVLVATKIVRVDDKTQIEVPVTTPDHIAIERFIQRKKLGPRPPQKYSKIMDDEADVPIEEIAELTEEIAESVENEEGDD